MMWIDPSVYCLKKEDNKTNWFNPAESSYNTDKYEGQRLTWDWGMKLTLNQSLNAEGTDITLSETTWTGGTARDTYRQRTIKTSVHTCGEEGQRRKEKEEQHSNFDVKGPTSFILSFCVALVHSYCTLPFLSSLPNPAPLPHWCDPQASVSLIPSCVQFGRFGLQGLRHMPPGLFTVVLSPWKQSTAIQCVIDPYLCLTGPTHRQKHSVTYNECQFRLGFFF